MTDVRARLLAALLGGLCLWVSFPGIGWWPAVVPGMALMTLATAAASLRVGALVGMAGGVAYFLPVLAWSGIYVGVLPWLALALLQAAFLALWGWLAALLQPLRARPGGRNDVEVGTDPAEPAALAPPAVSVRPVRVALAWVAVELLRSHLPYGGFPWARLAFSQADAPTGRVAMLAGAAGVAFVLALAGGLLAAATLGWFQRIPGRGVGRAVAAAVGALILIVLPGGIPLSSDGPTGRVLGVQGNVPRPGLDFSGEAYAVLENHVRGTQEAGRRVAAGELARPDVVVWPENSVDVDPLAPGGGRAASLIQQAVRAVGAPLLVGTILSVPPRERTNTSLLYLPDGSAQAGPVARYDKRHPVPFAEYIPHRSFYRLFSDKVDLVQRDMIAGDRVGVLSVPGSAGTDLAMGVSICFEVAGDDLVLDGVREGANLLVVQTNNATFGYTDESEQQLAISRIRAIEHNRSVVHVSTVGVSALITPDGTAHQQTALFSAATLSGDLPLRTALTPASRLGPWPSWLATVIVLGMAVRAVRTRRTTVRRNSRPSRGTP